MLETRPTLSRDRAPRCAILPGRFVAVFCLAAGFFLGPPPAAGVSERLGELSRALARRGSPENLAKLEEFAEQANGREAALARYSLGMAHIGAKRFDEAERLLAGVLGEEGWVGEYAAYFRARSIALAEEFQRSLVPLQAFAAKYPDSRFRPAADRLRVESLLRLRDLDGARAALDPVQGRLTEPVRFYLGGRVEHVAGNLETAIELYRRAYYFHPSSDQALASADHLNRLRRQMGGRYPLPPATWRLERAERLREGGRNADASAEYSRALGGGLKGTDRDRATIGKGAADYARRLSSTAYPALARARPSDPELNAWRLYLLCAIERRKGLAGEMASSIAKLARDHSESRWYEEALLTIGNFYYLRDSRAQYTKWFRQLVEAAPDGRHAPYAHWKLCWRSWLDHAPARASLLAEHLHFFPGASTAAGAMYWLGRLREEEGRRQDAVAHYRVASDRFPHYYYGYLARQRLGMLGNPELQSERGYMELAGMLPPVRPIASRPRAATKAILDVGDEMLQLGFSEDAEYELSRADAGEPDAHFAGLSLARLHDAEGDHHLAVRAMKRYVVGYLRVPFEALDEEYWRALYPLPFADQLRSRSERHGLDPYLVASLIRQESEFNAGARSSAGALGLMQVMPATGRTLFRRLGIAGFSNSKLTVPDISLRLGTFYLKETIATFDGRLEEALAAYNAGPHRIPGWLALGRFDDPAEFVETIPFSETRGYVQAVLRGREIYKHLYGE